MDTGEFGASARAALFGMAVFDARLGHGSILLVDVKESAGGAASYLRVECAWRLEDPSRVLAGSEDSRETLATHVAALNGRIVREVEVSGPGLELRVRFDDGKSLNVFPIFANTEEYENWTIHTPQRVALVAGPGSTRRIVAMDAS